jgi:HlyD family secretion protein
MARSLLRPAVALVILVVAGVAATLSYRGDRARRPSTTMVPGIVRETEIRIAPEVSGRLATVLVSTGQSVKKGEVIAVLDSPTLAASLVEARAAVEKARADRAQIYAGLRKEGVDIALRNVQIAEASLQLAQQQLVRANRLTANNVQSQQLLEEAVTARRKALANLTLQQANYDRSIAGPTAAERAAADARLSLSQATADLVAQRLAKTTLVAPVDGVVRLIVASPGEMISPGQPVLTLEAGRQRWFSFTLREDRLGLLDVGAPVTLADAEGHRIEARITELRPLGEFATWRAARAVGDHDINSFFLRAEPVGDTEGLEPGMTVWLAAEDAGDRPS